MAESEGSLLSAFLTSIARLRKIVAGDVHWLTGTVARELDEETGGLLSKEAIRHCANFDPRNDQPPPGSFGTHYIENSKYQVVVYPVPLQFQQEWLDLPERYAMEFSGHVPPPPASRSATKFHLVRRSVTLSRNLTMRHECSTTPEDCAKRCNRQTRQDAMYPCPAKGEKCRSSLSYPSS